MHKASILLVEDDENLAFVVRDNLLLAGYAVTHAIDGQEALDSFQAKDHDFDLCLLDVMLPKMDGFELGRNIRMTDEHIPILFLTAKGMQEDKLEGFKSGGDDYITKPFSMEELIFRIEVFLKRNVSSPIRRQQFQIGQLVFYYDELRLVSGNRTKHLTQKEGDILRFLCLQPNKVIKREDMLKEVWGEDDYFLGRSLDVFISKLRKYLAEDPQVAIINRHGIGFELSISKN